mmetsp:Transcript_17084/g.41157  ORF Transcript_17084/g.41157 Transcript_17084/m.41157 type:complete len:174 (-) Transcript_17084:97-618(-)
MTDDQNGSSLLRVVMPGVTVGFREPAPFWSSVMAPALVEAQPTAMGVGLVPAVSVQWHSTPGTWTLESVAVAWACHARVWSSLDGGLGRGRGPAHEAATERSPAEFRCGVCCDTLASFHDPIHVPGTLTLDRPRSCIEQHAQVLCPQVSSVLQLPAVSLPVRGLRGAVIGSDV